MTRQDIANLWGKDPRKRIEQLMNQGRMRAELIRVGRGEGWHYWSRAAEWTPALVIDEGGTA